MRTIKFRGQRLDNRQWIYGDLITFQNDYEICDHNTIDGSRYEVSPETVGQFTGLSDKNGKEICEGDIIEVLRLNSKPCRHIVRYNDETGSYCQFAMSNGELTSFGTLWQSYIIEHNKVIIGNIHDNPELLKQ